MDTTQAILKPPHGSLEWQQLRHRDSEGRCIVGASEVSTLMDCNPYESIADMAVRKLLPPTTTEANAAMTRGNVLEPALLVYAAEQLQTELETPEVMYRNGRIIATLDGRGTVDSSVVVEAKTSNYWALGSDFPDQWFWQAQAQMHCTGTSAVHFVVLDKYMRLGMETVQRHDTAIEQLLGNVEWFCAYIDRNELPETTSLTAPQVSLLYPQAAGERELPTDVLALIDEWNALKAALKDMEGKEKAVKDAIADLMRESEFGVVDGQRVLSFKTQTTKRFDTQGFATAHPDLSEQYTTTTTFRVLRTLKAK